MTGAEILIVVGIVVGVVFVVHLVTPHEKTTR